MDEHDGSQGSPGTGVIVTGAASGIGKAICLELAASGRPVSAWDVDGEGASATAAECSERFGTLSEGRNVDLRDASQIEAAATSSIEALGGIGGLAYAAGVMAATEVDRMLTGEWETVMDVNLRGFALLTRLLAPELRAHPDGAVVVVASTNAIIGTGANPAYCASKAGAVGLVRALAAGLGPDGVRVNAVCPGATDTPMLAPMISDPRSRKALVRQIAMRRLADPSEIARPVRFLLSAEAGYITGTTLVVDGGLTSCA